jgi:hypothetical protein
MSREFSVRVAEELARWVRQRGSATRVVSALASAAERGHFSVRVRDPGPGPKRLTVRLPGRALPLIRRLTRSRSSLVALRKLVQAGYQRQVAFREPIQPPRTPAVGPPLLGLSRLGASVVSPSENRPGSLWGPLASVSTRWRIVLVVLFVFLPVGILLGCFGVGFKRQGRV